MKNIYLLKILFLIGSSFINAEVLSNIKIKSDKVEFKFDGGIIEFVEFLDETIRDLFDSFLALPPPFLGLENRIRFYKLIRRPLVGGGVATRS